LLPEEPPFDARRVEAVFASGVATPRHRLARPVGPEAHAAHSRSPPVGPDSAAPAA
jgi:hypothetical protein